MLLQVCYLNCVRILCKHGANPNCSSRSNLTPLHVLVFTASENIALNREEEKAQNFEFIRNLLVLLLQYGLDPNVRFSQRTQYILQSLMDMVHNARGPSDINHVYDLTLTLIQYGANPNINISTSESVAVCHSQYSQSLLFLKKSSNHILYYYVMLICRKEELLLDPQQRFARIVWLYYLCMNHRELFACLKVLYTQQTGLVPVRGSALCNLVRELYARPRTLKQICRVVIYVALGRRPGMHVNKLPLPSPLKDYILNFEP